MSPPAILLVNHTVPVEPFLRDELPYLAALGAELTLMPTEHPGRSVERAEGVPVSLLLARTKGEKIRHALGGGGVFLWRALKRDRAPKDPVSLARLAHFSATAMACRGRLKQYIRGHGLEARPLLVYTYWFSPATHAAFLLKDEFPNLQVVSRAHGVDVFPDRHPRGYLPLRAMCANWVDTVCPCSAAGWAALRQSGVAEERIRLAYLGVPQAAGMAAPSPKNALSLVSCSNMQPVKRLPILMCALAAYARARPETAVTWTHLGGQGEAFQTFRRMAEQALAGVANLRLRLVGQLSPAEVRAFYLQDEVDVFVNTSASEGLPVSMMEALSAGVPVVGTRVGGVPELVNEITGRLLPVDFTAADFAAALDAAAEFKSPEKRQAIVEFFAAHFSQERNYPAFVTGVFEEALRRSRQALAARVIERYGVAP